MTEPRETDTDTSDDDFQLSKQDVEAIDKAIDEGDGAALDTLLEPTHAADIADLIEQLNPSRRREFLKLYSGEIDGDILSEIDEAIRERIGGGKASISGSFTTAEAQDLAIVLRAGSLPAPVSVLEERTVGPSLGQEAIDSGIRAAMVGAAGVVLFIGVYYGLSGLIADLMLCFTMLIVMAGMGAFGATLTLPGIAGIILAIGMGVDANVIAAERIKEEIR